MGAIVSYKKAPAKTSAQQKAVAVAAFTRNITSDWQTRGTYACCEHSASQDKCHDQGISNDVGQHILLESEYAEFAQAKAVTAAAVRIQSSYRGYQARQELEKERRACVLIQRKFREFRTRRGNSLQSKPQIITDNETKEEEEGMERKTTRKTHRRPWRESTTTAPVLDKDVKIGDKTKESFEQYQDDITDLKWETEQQLEMTLMGNEYTPQNIVLIASNVPRADVLAHIIHKDVIKICYDFEESCLQDLTDEIYQQLEQYKPNSKAQSIGLVCKGGPGSFNPVKGKVVTEAKVKKDQELNSFWQALGRQMSKVDPQNTKVHIIGNNVTGNKKGEKLLKFLSKTMKPSRVLVESPLELSQKGGEMLQLYFDPVKFKIWKSRMYSRVSFTL